MLSCNRKLSSQQLSQFPPHCSNPVHKLLYILPSLQLFHRVPVLCKLFIRLYTMHKSMACWTQPSDLVQLVLWMPSSLEHLVMRRTGDQMVVRQRYPIPLAEFTSICSGCLPLYGLRSRVHVTRQNSRQGCSQVQERVGSESVWDWRRHVFTQRFHFVNSRWYRMLPFWSLSPSSSVVCIEIAGGWQVLQMLG
jgi:hypothetical protein